MSEHLATIDWSRGNVDFTYEKYPRDHEWGFEGGATVAASAAPEYRGNPDLVDPESALVAALSSCHMLTFLAIAAKQGLVVDRYRDRAVGVLEKNGEGRLAITRVTLNPQITFSGAPPSAADLASMHHMAHERCFIASSVKTQVDVATAAPQPAGR